MPSPIVLVNGSSTLDGVNFLSTDSLVTITLEDPAGVNVWTISCIGTDETNNSDHINAYVSNFNLTTKILNAANLRGAYPSELGKGTAVIFRSVVNNGLDINGHPDPTLTTTFGIYILGYVTLFQNIRVGAVNETIEGDHQFGWVSKLNAFMRLANLTSASGDVTGNYPGPLTVVAINGTQVGTNPGSVNNSVLIGDASNHAGWHLITNNNIDTNAGIYVSKLSTNGISGSGTYEFLGYNGSGSAPVYTTLSRDLQVPYGGAAKVIGLQGKDLASALASIGASQDGYVLTWNNPFQYWEAKPQTGGGGGGSVTWANDLNGSSNTNQYVVNLSGTNSSGQVTLGTGGGDFILGGGVGNSDTYLWARDGTVNGHDLFLVGGTAGLSGTGGNVQVITGRAASGGSDNGTFYIRHSPPAPATGSTVFAEFAGSHVTIDPSITDSTSNVVINSGTGGTGLTSSDTIALTGATVNITTNTNAITLNGKTAINCKINGSPVSSILNGVAVDTSQTMASFYQAGSVSSGSGGDLWVMSQPANSTGSAGGTYITSGKATGTGHDGYIYMATGATLGSLVGAVTHIILKTATGITLNSNITVPNFAGSGAGYVAVDNTGALSFTSSAVPGGSAGGDLSGTYPNPTVAKINGATVPAAGGLTTGHVLQVSGASALSYGYIADANVSASAGIVYSKLSLSNSISNTDIATGAGIAYSKLNLTGSIVDADVSSSAAIAVSKLAAGTGGQFLINNTTPTPTWVTLSGDVALSNTSGTMRVDGFGHGQANAYSFPASAGSTGNTMYISGAGVLSFGALNLAGGSAYVTGSLPNSNQADQNMAGDVSGTTGANTVDKIKNRTVHDTAPNNGDVITWDTGNSYWKYAAPPTGVTWANDLTGSTNTNQYVAAISGNAGAGGTIPINATTLQYASGQTSPTISQASIATANATGQTLTVQAQNSTGIGTAAGGDLILTSGTGTNSVGAVSLQAGGVDRLKVFPNGVIQITGGVGVTYGTGIIHSDSTGALSSSTIVNADVSGSAAIAYSKLNLSGSIVNADVSSSAAIAVSKLAAGTAAQILMNNGTPAPTWTTVGGDATIGNTGSVTVTKIYNNAVKNQALGAGQDSYVLTWVNANSQWEAQPAPGAGGGVTTVGTFDSQTSAANGLVISGSSIYAQSATSSNPGMIKLAGDIGGTGSAPVVKTMQAATTATKTADYTITTSDYHIFCNFSAAHNLTLPTPANGMTYHIWDISGTAETNNITLVRHGTEKISGVAASRVLSTNWGHWTVTTDGTDWYVG